jgi:hypothetical protein
MVRSRRTKIPQTKRPGWCWQCWPKRWFLRRCNAFEGKAGIAYCSPGCPWVNGYIESFNNRLRKAPPYIGRESGCRGTCYRKTCRPMTVPTQNVLPTLLIASGRCSSIRERCIGSVLER